MESSEETKTAINKRVNREQAAYDEGDVLENNAQLQKKFRHVFECPNTVSGERYFEAEIQRQGRSPDKRALDYGCNSGWYAKKLKDWGFTHINGIDISKNAIKEANERHSSIGEFEVMDAHKTTFPNNYFDLVVGRSILHHLEFETAIKEIHRILKPGGKALFIEPLRDNPGAKFIRWLTPKARTKDELPLSAEQIKWADKTFGRQTHLFVGLISVGIGLGSSLISKNPNNLALRIADKADVTLGHSPLKYWMRQVILVWQKV